MSTDFKTLIEKALAGSIQTSETPMDHFEENFREGAALPNELLLKALNALEHIKLSSEILHSNEHKNEAYFLLFQESKNQGKVATETLAEIREALEAKGNERWKS